MYPKGPIRALSQFPYGELVNLIYGARDRCLKP